MLTIYLPDNHTNECEHTCEVLFSYILKIPFRIKKSGTTDYIFEIPTGKKLIIKNNFWERVGGDNFLQKKYLPGIIKYTSNQFTVDDNIPIIYGDEKIEIKEDSIICNIDLIASSFFMLSRWEELVDEDFDKHYRVKGRSSIAYKNNFLHRPIVNEYAEMLWNMLLSLGYQENFRKPIGYKIIPTHDIDNVYYSFKWANFLADIVVDKNISRAYKRFSSTKQNYWDTFDWIMDQSEKNNLTSIFYFLADSNHPLDKRYSLNDKFIKEKIELIKRRGHVIGLHPGYDTMLKKDEWLKQKQSLEKIAGQDIIESRQHYLRFRVPDTIDILESAGIKVDSSLCYSDEAGFRCGTSCEYPLFDFSKRKASNVFERPLIIMEITLRDRKKTEAAALKAAEIINSYKQTCKKYNIPFTVLFHNSSFEPFRWNGWKDIYENYVVT